jgi:hypothetical protein
MGAMPKNWMSCNSNDIETGHASFHPYNNIEELKNKINELEKVQKLNPRADKYIIEKSIQVDSNLVLFIKYLNCTNYEGNKILVYKNTDIQTLLKVNNGLLDPHFSNNDNFINPFARFVPTQEGLEKSIELAKII